MSAADRAGEHVHVARGAAHPETPVAPGTAAPQVTPAAPGAPVAPASPGTLVAPGTPATGIGAATAMRVPRAGLVRASWRLLRSELRLILGRRRNQAGLVVLAAVPILIAVALRISESPDEGRGGPDLLGATSNGIFVALTALSVEIALFLPLAVAVLSGDSIAGEANLGTLRYLLTVPVGRTRLLAIKYASLVIGSALGVLVVAGTGVLVGGALLGLGSTTLLSGTQVDLAEALMRLAGAATYIAVGLAAVAAIGLLISTLTEQPIAATISTTVVVTAMWIMDSIPQLDWLAPWLLVHRWSALVDVFRDPVFLDTIRAGLLVDVAYMAVFLCLAWARFARQDVTS